MRRLLIAIAVVTLFYFGTLIYPVIRILSLAWPDLVLSTPLLLGVIVTPLLLRISYEWRPGPVTRACSTLAFTWLGVYFLAFLPVIAHDLAALVLPIPKIAAGYVLAATTFALAAYAFINAQRLQILPIEVASPAALDGTRIAQISDVHIGSRHPRFLRRVVRRVNAERPDLVMITGDLIDFRAIGETELSALAQFDAPAYFCTGNHERYVDLEDICARLTNLGVHVLRNESVDLGAIQIAAIDDAESRTQVAERLPALEALADRFRILLYHRPDGAEAAAHWGAHLMLVGHTHAGQIFPFNFLVRRVFARLKGDFRIGEMLLHVSTGTGTWGPVMRLGSATEIGMIRLVGDQA